MGIIFYAKKYKAFSLLFYYWRNHVLLYALFQLLLIKKDRTGLELFRSCMEKKLYDKIKKKNRKLMENYSIESFTNQASPKKIWLCWFQGFDRAPELVKKCRDSVYKYCSDYEIIEITADNFAKYANIPNYILEKWYSGSITNTHFSDILRIFLLSQNGGLWIDSTVLLTGRIPADIEKSSLFVYQMLKPGRDGSAVFISSWFMKACSKHPIIELTRELLETYWKKNNRLCDYFLLHYFFCLACEKLDIYWESVPKYSNSTPHILFFNLFEKFNEDKFHSICRQTPIHKLSYKNIEEHQLSGSLYEELLQSGFNENSQ